MTNHTIRDIVVTVPAKLWFSWLCEGDLPNDPPEERGEWAFGTSKPSRSSVPGQRVYVVAHGFIRGYGELTRVMGNAFIRSGPGVACTLFKDGQPMPMRGFQGWRYATWRREDVRGWEELGEDAWATHGLPPKLAAEVQELLKLRRESPKSRQRLRDAATRLIVSGIAQARQIATGTI